ncbi:thiamine phosphate synthase [Pedobacter sp. MW01-1-1]|uniref:thiamine phosphate synthase n=1 Tax=Pedobacter sp. MW01-1-1 TaxID=3383027 RepID=UPI003FEF786B
MKYIEKFQFITQDAPHLSHVEQAQLACEAGAKWIQYRCLSKDDDALLLDIHPIAEICDDWGTTLIVTNHIHLQGKADIQGFHIEDLEADFIALRKLLGDDCTLGGSAVTVDGVLRLAAEGADYIGLGPFSLSRTKQNAYPVLGLEGYRSAMEKLKSLGLNIPVLAVGGIQESDVEALMQAGVFGIAVSGAINYADDFVEAYELFYDRVKA